MIYPMITAHSGCDGTLPDSLASVIKAAELGADCAEIDVRFDRKGHLILSHDKRESDDAVKLEDAFEVIKRERLCVNCDIKEYEAFLPTLACAKKIGLTHEQLYFSGSVRLEEISEDAKILLNIEELIKQRLAADADMNELAAAFKQTKACALNVPYRVVTEESERIFEANGIRLSVWTVDDAALQLYMLKNKNVMNVTTRKAEAALKARKSIL